MRKDNTSFTSFHHCLGLFRGTRRHRTRAPQQCGLWLYGGSTLAEGSIPALSLRAAETAKLVCTSPCNVWYLRTFNRFIFTTFPWDRITLQSPMTVKWSEISAQAVRTGTLREFKKLPEHSNCSRTSEDIDDSEKNKQKKNPKISPPKPLHYIVFLHVVEYLLLHFKKKKKNYLWYLHLL